MTAIFGNTQQIRNATTTSSSCLESGERRTFFLLGETQKRPKTTNALMWVMPLPRCHAVALLTYLDVSHGVLKKEKDLEKMAAAVVEI